MILPLRSQPATMARMPRPRLALLALAASTLVAALGSSIATVSLPAVVADFGVSLGQAQWVTLSFLLVSTVFVLPTGPLGDLVGRRRVLLWGLAGFVAASALSVTAPSLGVLVLARGLQGAAAAAVTAMSLALVRDIVPAARVGAAMGTLGASTASGMALGPALGGVLLGTGGWRSAFVVLGVLPAVALALAVAGVSEPVVQAQRTRGRDQVRRLDLVGAALLGSALTAYAVAVTIHPGGAPGTVSLLVLGAAVAAIFVRHERYTAYPLVGVAQLRRLRLLPELGSAFVAATVMISYAVLAPLLLALGLGLDPWAMGLVLAVSPVAAILTGWPAGRLVDRRGAGWAALVGLAAIAAGAVALGVLPSWLGVVGVVLGGLMAAPGNQLFMAGNATLLMTATSADEQGVAAGLVTLARNLGSVTGASVMVWLYTWAADLAGNSPGASAIAGFRAVLLTGALLAVASLVPARRRVAGRP